MNIYWGSTICQAIALEVAGIEIIKTVKDAYLHEVYTPVGEPDKQIYRYIYSIMTRDGKYFEEKWRKNRKEMTGDDSGKGAYLSKPIFLKYASLK